MNAEKSLNFRPLILLQMASGFAGFLVAILCAWLNFGAYALAYAMIASAVSGTLLAWFFLRDGWVPSLHFRWSEAKGFLGFGSAVMLSNLVNQINMGVDILLGGRLLGATAMGLYTVPRNFILQIQTMLNPIITRVGFPVIAELQKDVARVRRVYLKTISLTASANAPVYAAIFFFAPEFVAVLLGSQWIESVSLLRILAVWGFVRSTSNPVGSLIFGMGRADLAYKWNLCLMIGIIPSLIIGSKYGVIGLAVALMSCQVLLFVPGWYFLVKPLCQIKFLEYSKSALAPAVFATFSFAIGRLVADSTQGVASHLVVGGTVSSAIYAFLGYRFNNEWFLEMTTLVKLKKL